MLLYECYVLARKALSAIFYHPKKDNQKSEPVPSLEKKGPLYESLLKQGKVELELGNADIALRLGAQSIEHNRNNVALTSETGNLIDELFLSRIDGYDALLLVGTAAMEMYSSSFDICLYNQAYRALDRVSEAESLPKFQIDAHLALAQLAIERANELDFDLKYGIVDEDGQSKREEAQKHLTAADGMIKRLNIDDLKLEERVERLESKLQP